LAENEDDLQYNNRKLNRILQAYDMRISIVKTKAMPLEGRRTRRVKISINGQITEQVISCKYLGCNITMYRKNMDVDENIKKI
jgi:predicted component of type VI protein secretion system